MGTFYPKGSNPPRCRGWHRSNREIARQQPPNTPYRSTASNAYSEHVGVNRQAGSSHGETTSLYRRIAFKMMFRITAITIWSRGGSSTPNAVPLNLVLPLSA